MPRSGQFVAIWKHNGETWSITFKWVEGKLMECVDHGNSWVEAVDTHWPDDLSAIFIVM